MSRQNDWCEDPRWRSQRIYNVAANVFSSVFCFSDSFILSFFYRYILLLVCILFLQLQHIATVRHLVFMPISIKFLSCLRQAWLPFKLVDQTRSEQCWRGKESIILTTDKQKKIKKQNPNCLMCAILGNIYLVTWYLLLILLKHFVLILLLLFHLYMFF